ncbi:dehydrogenase [Sphingobium sp. 22B]|uniref:D-isomer specific 2-hydroxyacid dehydrogenase family protein n=1 Tax=unclassified Sphingobium TaxID=2611147 RepID=UPI00078143F6|nr:MULTISPECIES: D-isomer specific 2-hydroxyacid dehydrogenase family protein [unclassified Sphingobium]KXU32259.1 dehydrogenase [Sphingobium sp. AM]KYC32153.1 dehydrogenase [Sphingobium sp. 22B]OAP33155.1 dehydrogenase [Sphingobium sp. 20006FA]
MSLIIASQLEPDFNRSLGLHPSAPTLIDVAEDEPWTAANEADILLVRPSLAWRRSAQEARPKIWPGRLKWVYSASAGVDFYPGWLLDAPLVTCGRGVASEEIADYVIAAIYAHAKNLEAATARSRDQWVPRPLGRVSGTTIGIVGLGAIGAAVARRGLALGAQVIGLRRSGAQSGISGVQHVRDLETLAAEADHIVIAVPGTPETRHLFNEALFARIKPGAHLINIARGSVIDQEALIDALDSERLGFATLDVTDPEPLPEGHALYTHPRVRLTPHISSNYSLIRHRLLEKVNDDLSRFIRGEKPSDIVDPARGY